MEILNDMDRSKASLATLEIGRKLVALCQQNKNLEAVDTLYSSEIVSVEPRAIPGMELAMRGIDAIREKNVWWFDHHEINSTSIDGPFVNGDRFSVHFTSNVTDKKDGRKMDTTEVGLYTVRDGQIVNEEFFNSAE